MLFFFFNINVVKIEVYNDVSILCKFVRKIPFL